MWFFGPYFRQACLLIKIFFKVNLINIVYINCLWLCFLVIETNYPFLFKWYTTLASLESFKLGQLKFSDPKIEKKVSVPRVNKVSFLLIF